MNDTSQRTEREERKRHFTMRNIDNRFVQLQELSAAILVKLTEKAGIMNLDNAPKVAADMAVDMYDTLDAYIAAHDEVLKKRFETRFNVIDNLWDDKKKDEAWLRNNLPNPESDLSA